MSSNMRRHRSLEGIQRNMGLSAYNFQGKNPNQYYEPLNYSILENESNNIPSPVINNFRSNPVARHLYLQKVMDNEQRTSTGYRDNINNGLTGNGLYNNRIKSLDREYEMLKNSYENTLAEMNEMSTSIKNYWSPELKRERELRKEEHYRALNLQNKLHSMNDGQGDLLNSSGRINNICDIPIDMNGRQIYHYPDISNLPPPNRDRNTMLAYQALAQNNLDLVKNNLSPRDFTDKSFSNQEFQTLKMKMEKSELELAQKSVELNNTLLKAHQYEDISQELNKKVESLTKDSVYKDAQIQLLQDDLNALREKLEIKNQQIEHKDSRIKQADTEIDRLKTDISDFEGKKREGDQKINQLQIRFEQLERLIREKDTELIELRYKLQQQPAVKAEAQLHQLLDNAENDKKKLIESLEVLRKGAEVEKQQQLEAFDKESKQQLQTIEFLKKELEDREILLVSQNKKISELDEILKLHDNKDGDKGKESFIENLQKQLDEARQEVDKLLKIIQKMEQEKSNLIRKIEETGSHVKAFDKIPNYIESIGTGVNVGDQIMPLKQRITELEEALRESVGITTDKERKLSDNKKIIMHLTYQIEEYRKAIQRFEKAALDNANTDHQSTELLKLLEEERKNYLKQLLQLKKESLTSLLNEKENCIKLLELPKEQVRVHLDSLIRDRKRLQDKLIEENEMQQLIFRPPSGMFDNDFGNTQLANYTIGNTRLADWQQSTQNTSNPVIQSNIIQQGINYTTQNSTVIPGSSLHQNNYAVMGGQPTNDTLKKDNVCTLSQDDGIWT
ncbi:Bruchpilot [Strongyloides ratti]|uniref:Bruchpilot n=1 Tax=Strongyloides ratti TaxID=34506 RepID=A0A090KNZ7_STRRB|nr:Bruchpilot [Strongyloides ratti]CEF59318.1 Bruchpilot [Strongyloides ratti]